MTLFDFAEIQRREIANIDTAVAVHGDLVDMGLIYPSTDTEAAALYVAIAAAKYPDDPHEWSVDAFKGDVVPSDAELLVTRRVSEVLQANLGGGAIEGANHV